MKLKRKYRFIIAFVSLFCLLTLIQDTYAKYVSNANANTNITIARWNILVNEHDITNNSDFSNSITPVFEGSEHIASGIIAPLSEGYFDLEIDASSVDVSFSETITLNLGNNNTISDLKIMGYSLDGGTVTNFDDNPKIITKNVLLADTERTHTYRIYVKWLEGTDETMDNESDTEATKTGVASIKVDVNFTQIPE